MSVMAVALNLLSMRPVEKNSLTAATVESFTIDQASQKNSTGNPSGPGALFRGIENTVWIISSSDGIEDSFSVKTGLS